jgi:hypothetical protein
MIGRVPMSLKTKMIPRRVEVVATNLRPRTEVNQPPPRVMPKPRTEMILGSCPKRRLGRKLVLPEIWLGRRMRLGRRNKA